jgi:predicted metal-dependent peptidase
MNYPPSQILEEVARTGIKLLLEEAYYGHFLVNLNKRIEIVAIDTLAVGAEGNHFVLYINPAFWSEVLVKPEYRYGVFKHEILHLLFKHVTRSRDFANKLVYNIAADILVNQYIAPEQLPQGAVLLSKFVGIELIAEQTVDYYYEQLMALWHTDDPGQQQTPAYKYLQQIRDQELEALKRHALWELIANGSAVDQQLLDIQLANLVQIASQRTNIKDIGKLPASIQRQLAAFELKHVPEVNWRKVLRLFSESSSKTFLKNTLKKTSKRYGSTPGIKIRRRKKLLIALDTSGSIGTEELKVFFSEVYHIWKQGAEIQVVECDVAIGRVYAYQGKTPIKVTGGGGTNFTPPLVYANERYFPDAIIYFTDGYGYRPEVASRAPVMWLISKAGVKPTDKYWQDLPGRKVKMNE